MEPTIKRLRPEIEHELKLAIIVPFRDLDPRQVREAQLTKFAPHMHNFLGQAKGLSDYHIFIIEQSDDGRKFNRGKLLNIGYLLAKEQGFNVFIFHDVDLLPKESLRKWYETKPNASQVAHIARCWNRYNDSSTYLGGIVSFNDADFELIDGFPNTYWGWGGEDDELSKRVRQCDLKVVGPDKSLDNAIVDLEEMSLTEKLNWLRANRDVKCEIKWEVNDEHDKFRAKSPKPRWWGLQGLKDSYRVIGKDEARFDKCSLITVDVGVNLNDDGTEHVTVVHKPSSSGKAKEHGMPKHSANRPKNPST